MEIKINVETVILVLLLGIIVMQGVLLANDMKQRNDLHELEEKVIQIETLQAESGIEQQSINKDNAEFISAVRELLTAAFNS